MPVEAFLFLWEFGSDRANHPVWRAHLLAAVWDTRLYWSKNGGAEAPKPAEVAQSTVLAQMEAADWYFRQEKGPKEKGMCFVGHWELAVYLACITRNSERLESGLPHARQLAVDLMGEAAHWSLGLLQCELFLARPNIKTRNATLVTEIRLKEMLQLSLGIQERLEQQNNFGHVQNVLKCRQRIEILLGQPPSAQEVSRRLAISSERRASASSLGMMAAPFWKEAAELYQQAGLKDDASRAKQESRTSIERATAGGEFKRVSHSFTISDSEMDEQLRPFTEGANSATTVLLRMGSYLFAPAIGKPTLQQEGSVFRHLVTNISIVGDRVRSEIAPGTPEQKNYFDHEQIKLNIELSNSMMLSPLLWKLHFEFDLQPDHLFAVLFMGDILDGDDRDFIRRAVMRYFSGDYVSFIHLMVPRLEEWIRKVVKLGGGDITALRDGEMRERPLGELLREAEKKGSCRIVRSFSSVQYSAKSGDSI